MQFTQMPLPFTKMSGTGNDFILIDHRNPRIARDVMPEFVRLACRRRFSVGADGLIFIEDSDQADFKWLFFNADGSEAEMCGNGARCAARFAYMQGIAPAHMRFETLAGTIEANVADTNVSLLMTPPKDFRLGFAVDCEEISFEMDSVDTGVPHGVVMVEDYEQIDVRKHGSQIRHHQEFMPAGTNVNFVMPQEGGAFQVRTYERGVEDETMACGTGAIASALIAAVKGMASSPVDIITSGEDRLQIIFDLQEGPAAKNVFLKGPTNVIYNGEMNAEALLGK